MHIEGLVDTSSLPEHCTKPWAVRHTSRGSRRRNGSSGKVLLAYGAREKCFQPAVRSVSARSGQATLCPL